MSSPQSSKGSEVQMVVVCMRDENNIDLRQLFEWNSRFAQSRYVIAESPAEDRIGENIDTAQPEKNCCVIDEGQGMQTANRRVSIFWGRRHG